MAVSRHVWATLARDLAHRHGDAPMRARRRIDLRWRLAPPSDASQQSTLLMRHASRRAYAMVEFRIQDDQENPRHWQFGLRHLFLSLLGVGLALTPYSKNIQTNAKLFGNSTLSTSRSRNLGRDDRSMASILRR